MKVKNKHKIQIKNGMEILKAVLDLSIVAIREGVFIIPYNRQNYTKNLSKNQDMHSYLTKYQKTTNENDKINNESLEILDFSKLYDKFRLSQGITFDELFTKCFKLNNEDFSLKISENEIKIQLMENCQNEFLLQNCEILSKKISKLNSNFNKKRLIALKQYEKKIKKAKKASLIKKNDVIRKINSVKKERFVI